MLPLRALPVFLAMALAPGLARAASPSETCISAAEAAQLSRYQGALKAAHDGFVSCARPECPAQIQADCAKWLSEVDASLPTIVPMARFEDGTDVVDARVTVDGADVADRGRAVPLDPGEHEVRFARGGSPPVTVRVLLHEGEKNRAVRVTLERAAPAPALVVTTARPERRVPVASIVLASVAGVGLGIGTGLYVSGRGGLDDLRSTCGNACREEDVDGERTKLLAGDLLLAGSVVALGVAAYLFFARR